MTTTSCIITQRRSVLYYEFYVGYPRRLRFAQPVTLPVILLMLPTFSLFSITPSKEVPGRYLKPHISTFLTPAQESSFLWTFDRIIRNVASSAFKIFHALCARKVQQNLQFCVLVDMFPTLKLSTGIYSSVSPSKPSGHCKYRRV
jgi:hypothetical protein